MQGRATLQWHNSWGAYWRAVCLRFSGPGGLLTQFYRVVKVTHHTGRAPALELVHV